MSKRLAAHLALLMVALIYGGNYVIAAGVMRGDHLEPFGFVLLRAVFATVAFWITGLFIRDRSVEVGDFKWLALAGLLGVAANQMLFFKGLELTTASHASLIMTTTPIVVMIAAAIFLREKIVFKRILGICLGFSGAILLILFKGGTGTATDVVAGDILIFINACFYAGYLIVIKPLMKKYHALTVVKWAFTFGLMIIFIFGFRELTSADISNWSISIWASVGYVLIGTTFLAYLLNAFAMKDVSPTVVAIYIYIQPVLATTLSFALNLEELGILKLVAAVLIFSGVYLVSMARVDK